MTKKKNRSHCRMVALFCSDWFATSRGTAMCVTIARNWVRISTKNEITHAIFYTYACCRCTLRTCSIIRSPAHSLIHSTAHTKTYTRTHIVVCNAIAKKVDENSSSFNFNTSISFASFIHLFRNFQYSFHYLIRRHCKRWKRNNNETHNAISHCKFCLVEAFFLWNFALQTMNSD